MFKELASYEEPNDLKEYIETVTADIRKHIVDVTVTKTVYSRANQKPWLTAKVWIRGSEMLQSDVEKMQP